MYGDVVDDYDNLVCSPVCYVQNYDNDVFLILNCITLSCESGIE